MHIVNGWCVHAVGFFFLWVTWAITRKPLSYPSSRCHNPFCVWLHWQELPAKCSCFLWQSGRTFRRLGCLCLHLLQEAQQWQLGPRAQIPLHSALFYSLLLQQPCKASPLQALGNSRRPCLPTALPTWARGGYFLWWLSESIVICAMHSLILVLRQSLWMVLIGNFAQAGANIDSTLA